MHTDQGRNFESSLFQSFCSLLEIAKTRTTPYRPSANGQVERYNQLVLNYLRSFLSGKQREWDQYLPVLGMAVRATVNRSTGFSPNMLQLGREVVMPVDIWLGLRQQSLEQTPGEYLTQLRQTMKEVHAEVRSNLRTMQSAMKLSYDVKTKVQSFNVGDLV